MSSAQCYYCPCIFKTSGYLVPYLASPCVGRFVMPERRGSDGPSECSVILYFLHSIISSYIHSNPNPHPSFDSLSWPSRFWICPFLSILRDPRSPPEFHPVVDVIHDSVGLREHHSPLPFPDLRLLGIRLPSANNWALLNHFLPHRSL